MVKLEEKDTADILDYQIDWTDLLAEDTIATSVWVIGAGITKVTDTNTTTTATIWLSGGVVNTDYTCTNRITTAGGRTWERSVIIPVRDL